MNPILIRHLADVELRDIPRGPGVYQIHNARTGDAYVGATSVLRKRARFHLKHLTGGTHHCRRLLENYQQHGPDVFTFEVLELVTVRGKGKPHFALYPREQAWMLDLKPTLNTVTVHPAGIGWSLPRDICDARTEKARQTRLRKKEVT